MNAIISSAIKHCQWVFSGDARLWHHRRNSGSLAPVREMTDIGLVGGLLFMVTGEGRRFWSLATLVFEVELLQIGK